VIGQGYVGVSLACVAAEAGFTVTGVDVESHRVAELSEGRMVVAGVDASLARSAFATGRLTFSTSAEAVAQSHLVFICVPTPLHDGTPDLSYVERACADVAAQLSPGTLVVLECSTYPGTTEELVKPLLETSGLTAGRDFLLAYSPERIDPGNAEFVFRDVPRVVGGLNAESTGVAVLLYEQFVEKVMALSSCRAAELAKLLENTFRHVNVALANEMAMVCHEIDIDVWEVIDAAATKPFGFTRFDPGPGMGGHCLPVDPFYLTWKAREYDMSTEFIELAGKVNEEMPYFCRSLVSQALNHAKQKAMKGAKILVLGVAYKPDIADMRESPALKLISLLHNAGADVSYHDPYVASFDENGLQMRSVAYEPAAYDCVVIATDHHAIDYAQLVDDASLIVDMRNATGSKGTASDKVFKL
jgi:UDP-N-acetyl-D-glucosamine dehydrogenase